MKWGAESLPQTRWWCYSHFHWPIVCLHENSLPESIQQPTWDRWHFQFLESYLNLSMPIDAPWRKLSQWHVDPLTTTTSHPWWYFVRNKWDDHMLGWQRHSDSTQKWLRQKILSGCWSIWTIFGCQWHLQMTIHQGHQLLLTSNQMLPPWDVHRQFYMVRLLLRRV